MRLRLSAQGDRVRPGKDRLAVASPLHSDADQRACSLEFMGQAVMRGGLSRGEHYFVATGQRGSGIIVIPTVKRFTTIPKPLHRQPHTTRYTAGCIDRPDTPTRRDRVARDSPT